MHMTILDAVEHFLALCGWSLPLCRDVFSRLAPTPLMAPARQISRKLDDLGLSAASRTKLAAEVRGAQSHCRELAAGCLRVLRLRLRMASSPNHECDRMSISLKIFSFCAYVRIDPFLSSLAAVGQLDVDSVRKSVEA